MAQQSIYTCYHLDLDANTKKFVIHQSCIVVNWAMVLLDKVDNIQESLRHVEHQCHRTFKHHASIVDVLGRDSKISNYTVLLSEEVDLL